MRDAREGLTRRRGWAFGPPPVNFLELPAQLLPCFIASGRQAAVEISLRQPLLGLPFARQRSERTVFLWLRQEVQAVLRTLELEPRRIPNETCGQGS